MEAKVEFIIDERDKNVIISGDPILMDVFSMLVAFAVQKWNELKTIPKEPLLCKPPDAKCDLPYLPPGGVKEID